MASMGIPNSPSDTGNGFHSSSSSSDGNKGSNTENVRELTLLDTFNNGDEVDEQHVINDMETEREEDRRPVGGSSIQRRRKYNRLSQEQTDLLEASFQQKHFPDKRTKQALADTLKMTLNQVQVWFLNRRARLKKQTMEQKEELDSYKMQVESLTNETHRLHRLWHHHNQQQQLEKQQNNSNKIFLSCCYTMSVRRHTGLSGRQQADGLQTAIVSASQALVTRRRSG